MKFCRNENKCVFLEGFGSTGESPTLNLGQKRKQKRIAIDL